jgi:hypothetical protein
MLKCVFSNLELVLRLCMRCLSEYSALHTATPEKCIVFTAIMITPASANTAVIADVNLDQIGLESQFEMYSFASFLGGYSDRVLFVF